MIGIPGFNGKLDLSTFQACVCEHEVVGEAGSIQCILAKVGEVVSARCGAVGHIYYIPVTVGVSVLTRYVANVVHMRSFLEGNCESDGE